MSYAVIIAGSRNIEATDAEIDELIEQLPHEPDIIFSGACPRGIDPCGERWAQERGIPLKRFPAQWLQEGKRIPWAGAQRNGEMADEADALILIWTGSSKGSRNMKKQAKAAGLLIVEKVKDN